MNSKQAFFGFIGLSILVAAATILVVMRGSGMLAAKGQELSELKRKDIVLEDRKDALLRAKLDIEKYAELEAIAKSIVPQEKDQARTVREIVAIASETGVSLSSIQFPSSALGGLQKGASRTSGAPVQNSATSQLTPVEGISGLYAMEITIQSNSEQPVSYAQLLGFLERLEQNRRTAHVINLSISPTGEDRNQVTFSVKLNVYIKP